MEQETLRIEIPGAKFDVPQDAVLRALLLKLGVSPALSPEPRIGVVWSGHGGIFVGLGRNAEGRSYRLIAAPEEFAEASFDKQQERAAGLVVDGLKDFACPFRRDQSLCFANVPELFKKEWYWSQEQCAPGPSYAWAQGFDDGGQGNCLKDDEFRARAVRREFIE